MVTLSYRGNVLYSPNSKEYKKPAAILVKALKNYTKKGRKGKLYFAQKDWTCWATKNYAKKLISFN